MAKQILISQGDYGIIFKTTIIDDTKKPITVGEETIVFYITTPSGEKLNIDKVNIVDKDNGIVEFVLNEEHTSEVGVHMIYAEISTPLQEVTSVMAENYYVMEEHGGV